MHAALRKKGGVAQRKVKMASLKLHDSMYILDGLVVPKFIKQEVLDKLKDLSLRDDDV